MEQSTNFKPNMYPIMYWALAFGAAAGVALFIMFLLSRFITIVWFPVFLVGLVWGGYKNYQKQKQAWMAGAGVSVAPQSPMQEFKQAIGDIASASRDMMAEQRLESQAQAEQQALEEQELLAQQQELPQEDEGQPDTTQSNYPPQNQPPTV